MVIFGLGSGAAEAKDIGGGGVEGAEIDEVAGGEVDGVTRACEGGGELGAGESIGPIDVEGDGTGVTREGSCPGDGVGKGKDGPGVDSDGVR